MMPDLYHYTCPCQASAIERCGYLKAAARLLDMNRIHTLIARNPSLRFSTQMVWLTTLPDVTPVTRESCGLSNMVTTCDRTAVRFRVLTGQPIVPWAVLRERWPADVVTELESPPGSRPGTWWVSADRVFVTPAPRLLPVA